MKKIRGIIFDCDGVLFDSKDVNIQFYNQVRSFFDLPPMSPQEEDFVHMHSVKDSFDYILPDKYESRLSEIREQVDYSGLLKYMRVEDGLSELLDFLIQKKMKMAVNTNRTTTMNLLLRTFNLERYFWPVVTAADVGRPKPHPESMHKILSIWSYSPGDVVFIGDSIVDQETARNTHITFWGYKNETLEAQMLVPDFWTLRAYLMRKL